MVTVGPLSHWDVAFWSERLREQRFAFTDEQLRPYFSLDRVLNGLFELCHRLFGITVKSADGKAPIWNPDVRFYEIFDESQKQIAGFYLDPYSRRKTNAAERGWPTASLVRRLRMARDCRSPPGLQ